MEKVNNEKEGGLKLVKDEEIPQEQGTEQDQKTAESLEYKPEHKKNLPTEFHLEIDIKKSEEEENTWKAVMKDKDMTWEGEAETPMNAVKSMLNNIELFNIKDETKKMQRFMVLNFDSAKALILQIKDILGYMGNDWFTVYQITVKTGQQKQEIEKKLLMLQTYGLLEIDRPFGTIGQRWKIVKSQELQKEILQRRLDIAKNEVEQVEFQMKELLLNDKPTTPVL